MLITTNFSPGKRNGEYNLELFYFSFLESKAGLEQMKLLLTLLLGAAVQCPNKQFFIARIKELEYDTQMAIVNIIQQVTDSQTLVLNRDTSDDEKR